MSAQSPDNNGNPFPEGIITLSLESLDKRAGFVTVWHEGYSITARLSAAQTELVLALNKQLLADEDLDPVMRGWRARQSVISTMEYPIELDSLNHAVYRLNRKFRRAAAKSAPGAGVPPLIATQRLIGIRLSWKLRVGYLGERDAG